MERVYGVWCGCTARRTSTSPLHTFNLDEYVGLAPRCELLPVLHEPHLFDGVNIDKRNTHLPCGVAPDLDAECRDYER